MLRAFFSNHRKIVMFQLYAFEDIVDGNLLMYHGRYTNVAPHEHNRMVYVETENCVALQFPGSFVRSPEMMRPGVTLQNCIGRRFLCHGEDV